MKVSLEYLYHFACESCQRWWSIADIEPHVGDPFNCPHCGHTNTVEVIHTFRDGVWGNCLKRQPDTPPTRNNQGC
ncbi:MAG: hypothetical protein HC926_02535 [Synechococcaceae cyanobacterium SM2_3_60]|nr:hypothetical protein [Synechococcaceae cyanobacterium SM2_3_60]